MAVYLVQLNEPVTEKKRSDVFELFSQVVGIKRRDDVFNEPMITAEAMNAMDLGKREKGGADGSFWYKTLLGRYFSKSISVKKKEAGKKSEHAHSIKCGYVVSIEDCGERKFIVFVLWKVFGKKWFLVKEGVKEVQEPKWENGAENKNYHLGLREVDKISNGLMLMRITEASYMVLMIVIDIE